MKKILLTAAATLGLLAYIAPAVAEENSKSEQTSDDGAKKTKKSKKSKKNADGTTTTTEKAEKTETK